MRWNKDTEAREKLYFLIRSLELRDTEELIKKALDYFKECFHTRTASYPGDTYLYELFSDFLKKGFTINEAHNATIGVIDREMILIDMASSFGGNYNGHFYPESTVF